MKTSTSTPKNVADAEDSSQPSYLSLATLVTTCFAFLLPAALVGRSRHAFGETAWSEALVVVAQTCSLLAVVWLTYALVKRMIDTRTFDDSALRKMLWIVGAMFGAQIIGTLVVITWIFSDSELAQDPAAILDPVSQFAIPLALLCIYFAAKTHTRAGSSSSVALKVMTAVAIVGALLYFVSEVGTLYWFVYAAVGLSATIILYAVGTLVMVAAIFLLIAASFFLQRSRFRATLFKTFSIFGATAMLVGALAQRIAELNAEYVLGSMEYPSGADSFGTQWLTSLWKGMVVDPWNIAWMLGAVGLWALTLVAITVFSRIVAPATSGNSSTPISSKTANN